MSATRATIWAVLAIFLCEALFILLSATGDWSFGLVVRASWFALGLAALLGLVLWPGLWLWLHFMKARRLEVSQLWAALPVAALGGIALQRFVFFVTTRYKEPQLAAALVAVVALALVPILVMAQRGIARYLRPRLGGVWAAPLFFVIGVVAIVGIATTLIVQFSSTVRQVLPWRILLSIGVAWLGAAWGLYTGRPHRLRYGLALGAVAFFSALILTPAPDVRYAALSGSASPIFFQVARGVRAVTDFDRDGFGSFFGENDCAPRNSTIHPGAMDVPDNGIDENCDGRDVSVRDIVRPSGPVTRAPTNFVRPWNVLLITVDTVRYDHTTMGGYASGPKARNTTPRLAEFSLGSTAFTFAQAPSAGTMASIPSILTSRFFHSGIALDEVNKKPGSPPKLKPENTTLPEVMKRAGYRTGAILTHEYFNDWGMDQGVDDYDNSIGRTSDPYRVTSPAVTDRALAWIARQRSPWFLWTHYLDPHGRYVAHPNGPSYGGSEEDLYDGELAFTDIHLGRLFEGLAALPDANNTVVIITSDHGDGFNEHGFINHAQALYREILHIPLIIRVPGVAPRLVDGAVTPMDILPTIAELAGIDISDLALEGRSLAPQIFYGEEDRGRIVFAETNWSEPIRAAVREGGKLVVRLKSNVWEYYDLVKDPWEKRNLAAQESPAFRELKAAMNDWLARVLYARDPLFNQATFKLKDTLLAQAPTPQVASTAMLDDGRLHVLGFDVASTAKETKWRVYLRVTTPPTTAWRFGLTVTAGTNVQRVSPRVTLDGFLPSDRWQAGDTIAEEFVIQGAPKPGPLEVALVLVDHNGPQRTVPPQVIGTVTP